MFKYGGNASYKSGLRGLGDTVSLTPYFSTFVSSNSTPAMVGQMSPAQVVAIDNYIGPDPGWFTNIYGNSPFASPADFTEWVKENQNLLIIGAVLGLFVFSSRRR